MSATKRTFPGDFSDLLRAFESAGVEYLVVGGYAVGAHGRPRATKDLDLWIAGGDNLDRVARALVAFGLPGSVADAARALGPNEVLYFGSPPLRVDLLRSIAGIELADALPRAVRLSLGELVVPVIGLEDLIANKRAAGRPRDLADAAALARIAARLAP